MSKALGFQIQVGDVRATWGFDFQVYDVIGVEDDSGMAAARLRIRWVLLPPRGQRILQEIYVEKLSLTFASDSNGRIQPARLAEFFSKVFTSGAASLVFSGDALSRAWSEQVDARRAVPGTLIKDSTYDRNWARVQKVPIIISGGSLRWLDAEDNALFVLSGLDVTFLPVRRHDVAVAYLACAAEEVAVGNARLRGLQIEVVEANDKRILLNLHADDWGTFSRPGLLPGEARELLDRI